MISDIGRGASVAMLTRSLQGLADILKSANEQSLNLANNLLPTRTRVATEPRTPTTPLVA